MQDVQRKGTLSIATQLSMSTTVAANAKWSMTQIKESNLFVTDSFRPA
jgi:hypothetical protein